jgi:hypothetical protein
MLAFMPQQYPEAHLPLYTMPTYPIHPPINVSIYVSASFPNPWAVAIIFYRLLVGLETCVISTLNRIHITQPSKTREEKLTNRVFVKLRQHW